MSVQYCSLRPQRRCVGDRREDAIDEAALGEAMSLGSTVTSRASKGAESEPAGAGFVGPSTTRARVAMPLKHYFVGCSPTKRSVSRRGELERPFLVRARRHPLAPTGEAKLQSIRPPREIYGQ